MEEVLACTEGKVRRVDLARSEIRREHHDAEDVRESVDPADRMCQPIYESRIPKLYLYVPTPGCAQGTSQEQ